jgi:hypothetical protein
MLTKEVNLAFFRKKTPVSKGVLSETDLKILWVSRKLSDIDCKFETEFLRIRQSIVHRDLKKVMREALISTYRRRRAPYLKMLTELRNKQRQFPC